MPTFRDDQKIGSKVPMVKTADLNDACVTGPKILDGCITKGKIAVGAVDDDIISNGSIVTSKLGSNSVTTDKIKDSSVTNAKLADNSLTINKFDPELRKSLQAATGLPGNLLEMVQDVDISIAELQDTVFPITLGFSVTPDVKAMQTAIAFSVQSKGSPFLPDTLKISKTVNNGVTTLLTDSPSSSGSLSTPISGAKEQFTFEVTKEGRTGKSTSATRFLCYYGSSSVSTASEAVLNSLQKVSTTGLSFNPTITTRSGDYIWLVVPNDLTISRVTSAGFDVTLAAAQTVTNSLGTFKAYRTVNTLTAETWKLVIS